MKRKEFDAGEPRWIAGGTCARRVAVWMGLTAATLGVLAGVVQLGCGSIIREWTGGKMDAPGLDSVTIGLSLAPGATTWGLARTLALVWRWR